MKLVALPDKTPFRGFPGNLQFTVTSQIIEQFHDFREGHHTRIGAALIHKAILLIGSNLTSDPAFFFNNHDIVAFFLQVVGRAESCQTGSYNDNSSILHDQ